MTSNQLEYRSAWARSGAMHLTGRVSRPHLIAPDATVAGIVQLGAGIGVDSLGLLGERAVFSGSSRRGPVSCGGASRLIRGMDGWIVASLPREDDLSMIPAWLEVDGVDADDPWALVERRVQALPVARLVERARLLGLAVGEVPLGPVELRGRAAGGWDGLPVTAERFPTHGRAGGPRGSPLVVDLSSLWAGPLCARLLAERGADVVKVESLQRPDGARRGSGAFFDLMHAGHRSVALDLASPKGRRQLAGLLDRADVVIEASRPRALQQLGIERRAFIDSATVWLAITGHGSLGLGSDRIGFGDDAAATGGLVAWDGLGPCFVADAVADPLSGVVAAGAAVAALDAGGGWLIDVAMVEVARHVAPPPAELWLEGDLAEVSPPAVPEARGRAPELGEHTGEVMRELRLS